VALALLVTLEMVMPDEWVSKGLRQQVIEFQFKAQKRAGAFPIISRVCAA